MKERIISGVARFLGHVAKRATAKLPASTIVIGVTGSSGKTSTKEAIGMVVSRALGEKNVVVSSGNLNNELGLPLAILGYKEVPSAWRYPFIMLSAWYRAWRFVPASAYVLEYAVDSPGDMDHLVSIMRPNVAVITNIASVHLENYPSLEALVAEKTKIARSLPQNGVLIINGDDKHLANLKEEEALAVRCLTYGSSSACDVRLMGYKLHSNATDFVIKTNDKEQSYAIEALGEQHILAVLPAIAIAKILELDHSSVKQALSQYQPLPGRGNIIFGNKDIVIINDTYNANPLSTEKMLEVLKAMPSKHKVAVLGDMLELGDQSVSEHRRILILAKQAANIVITVGRRMADSKLATHSFLSPTEAAAYLKENIEPGSVIAVKGSQSMRMEIIVKELMLNPDKAEAVLPRQSASWLKKPFELV
jgi:UDP-N-acetylmuramoyl-tripeptide--D-alanyl-D-alanine ligase